MSVIIDLLKPALNKVIPTRTDIEYRTDNKDKIKHYYITNKDKIKQYRTVNEDKIKEYRATKYVCLCGSISTVHNKSHHEQSLKHKKFINEQKNPEVEAQP